MPANSSDTTPDTRELTALALRYGQPEVLDVPLEADEYLFRSRQHRASRRRGEVVMVIEQTAGSVLVHRKGWYARGVYRLPTGGIEAGDSVDATLIRELKEETGLSGGEVRFLGVITCLLQYRSNELAFRSNVFHILHPSGDLRIPDSKEDISDVRDVSIDNLPEISRKLREVPDPRSGWGQWRAIAHDFVYRVLTPDVRKPEIHE